MTEINKIWRLINLELIKFRFSHKIQVSQKILKIYTSSYFFLSIRCNIYTCQSIMSLSRFCVKRELLRLTGFFSRQCARCTFNPVLAVLLFACLSPLGCKISTERNCMLFICLKLLLPAMLEHNCSISSVDSNNEWII